MVRLKMFCLPLNFKSLFTFHVHFMIIRAKQTEIIYHYIKLFFGKLSDRTSSAKDRIIKIQTSVNQIPNCYILCN